MCIIITLYVKSDTYTPCPKGLNDFHDFFLFPSLKKKYKISAFNLSVQKVCFFFWFLSKSICRSQHHLFFPLFFRPFYPSLLKGEKKPIYILDKKGKIIITTTRQGKKALSSLPSLNSHPLWFSSSKKPHSPNDRSLSPMISPPAPKPWRRELRKKKWGNKYIFF